jgi:outer membrane biosynthesis protein TonB
MPRRSDGLSWGGVAWNAFLWLVVPGVLFWVGYNVVGPRVGHVPELEAKVGEIAGRLAGDAAPPASAAAQAEPETGAGPPQPGVPDVQITVAPAKEKPKPAPRKRARPRPAEPEPERPAEPRRDEASADGAAATGGTPPPAEAGDGG